MVIKIDKEIEVIKMEEPLNLPEKLKKQIESFWEKQVEQNPHLFNGEIWTVTKFEKLSNKIRLIIQKSNYAHYLYDERVGIEGEFGCYNLSCGILLETIDGYYVIGEMGKNTSCPGILQTSGGNLDQNDIKPNGEVDVQNTIARELKEEFNIDLFNTSIVSKYEMKYIGTPEGKIHNYPLLMKGTLTLTVEETQEYYNKYVQDLKQTGGTIEFDRLIFLKKENALAQLKKMPNPRRLYLEGIIEQDSNEAKKIQV